MHAARLIEVEIAPDGILVEIILEEIDPLEHIGLFDEDRPENSVP